MKPIRQATKADCTGCRNDIYNHGDFGLNMRDGEPRCSHLQSAVTARQVLVHINETPPWRKAAMELPVCYRKAQFVTLPADHPQVVLVRGRR